jgi:peptide/nickel transport system permease protein
MSGLALPATAARPRRKWPKLRVAPLLGLLIVGLLLVCAITPELVAPYSPTRFDYRALLHAPNAAHWFGTDNFGRDVFSRVIWATRIDLQIALFSTLAPVIVGTTAGALVAYYGGIGEVVLLRLVDLVVTLPFLVLVIAIIAVLGPGLGNMYLAISLVDWVFYARLMRAEVQGQMRRDYASAGRVMGYGAGRIIFRHLAPNALPPILVYWMTDMALAILLGSSLGYLGLGAQPPAAEWGVLISDGRNFMATAWWMSVFPGIAIVLAGVGFTLLGDGVAELLRRRG